MKSKLMIRILIIVVSVFALILLYLYLFIYPRVKEIREIENEIVLLETYKDLLIENRVALTSYLELDPQRNNFVDEKSNLLKRLRDKEEEFMGISDLRDSDINSEVSRIRVVSSSILERLFEIDTSLSKIYSYDVYTDLYMPFNRDDYEDLINRVSGLVIGLQELQDNLDEEQLNGEISPLINDLEELEQLLIIPEGEDIQGQLDTVAEDYANLKTNLFDYELSQIKSAEGVWLLRDITNLIISLEDKVLNLDTKKKDLEAGGFNFLKK